MYKTMMVLICMLFVGCAHKTIHEVCSDVTTLSHYRDYDQCYAEETARREAKRQAWSRVGAAFQPRQSRSVSCVTNGNITNCN